MKSQSKKFQVGLGGLGGWQYVADGATLEQAHAALVDKIKGQYVCPDWRDHAFEYFYDEAGKITHRTEVSLKIDRSQAEQDWFNFFRGGHRV